MISLMNGSLAFSSSDFTSSAIRIGGRFWTFACARHTAVEKSPNSRLGGTLNATSLVASILLIALAASSWIKCEMSLSAFVVVTVYYSRKGKGGVGKEGNYGSTEGDCAASRMPRHQIWGGGPKMRETNSACGRMRDTCVCRPPRREPKEPPLLQPVTWIRHRTQDDGSLWHG